MYDFKVDLYDMKKWYQCVEAFGSEGMKKLKKRMLGRVGEGVRGEIVKNKLRGQVLGRITGDLAAHMYWNIEGDSVDIGNNLIYARIHELGGEIRPIAADALRFKIDGKWITTKLVKMPARPYIGPTIESWAENGKVTEAVEGVLDQEIAKQGAN